MLLEKLVKSNPEEVFIYLERYVNDIFYSDVDDAYKPHTGLDSFHLPFVLMNDSEAVCLEAYPDERIKIFLQNEGRFKFFLHPQMLKDCKEECINNLFLYSECVNVSPTSSTRTSMRINKYLWNFTCR